MTVLYCIQQLKEYVLYEIIIPEIATIVEDLREQIAIAGVVHDDVRVGKVLDHAVESNDVWMCRCKLMESNLTNMEVTLTAGLLLGVSETFNGKRFREGRADVDGTVHDTVSTYSEDLHELKFTVVDQGAEGGVNGGGGRLGRHWDGERTDEAPVRTESGNGLAEVRRS
jgi:hypothetical protein